MIVTVQQHILHDQKRFPGASGEFSWLLSGITRATKIVQARVRRAGLSDILGDAGETNIQGEVPQKLDIYGTEAMMHCRYARGRIGVVTSEENEHPQLTERRS